MRPTNAHSCVQGTVDSTDEVTCTAEEMPSGAYALQATLADDQVLYTAASFTVDFAVTSVSPSNGSMAGGSIVTISGALPCLRDDLYSQVRVTKKVRAGPSFCNSGT